MTVNRTFVLSIDPSDRDVEQSNDRPQIRAGAIPLRPNETVMTDAGMLSRYIVPALRPVRPSNTSNQRQHPARSAARGTMPSCAIFAGSLSILFSATSAEGDLK
jgi:hypothetical protein